MAKFLNTTGTSYHLEELIKKTTDRLVLISPYLQFNERIKELLEDKNRLKIDIRIVCRTNQLSKVDTEWLKNLTFVRVSQLESLHAKCYLSENQAIITSLNLYQFSQVNNNEMGILIDKSSDNELYAEIYEECQRIIRISDEMNFGNVSIDNQVNTTNHHSAKENKPKDDKKPKVYDKISTAKLAEKFGMETEEFRKKLQESGYIEIKGKNDFLTDKGKEIGGEVKKGQYGYFIVWSVDLEISFDDEKTSFADKLKNLFKR